jgi:uncharacterized membrane protein
MNHVMNHERLRTGLRYALALTMLSVGVLHFTADHLFVQIVPKQLPAPYWLVWISGVIELGLGLSLLPARTRRLAGYGLVALYVAVFPANIYMAIENVQMQGLPAWAAQPSPLMLWLRLPLQLVFIGWALWVSAPSRDAQVAVTATQSPRA